MSGCNGKILSSLLKDSVLCLGQSHWSLAGLQASFSDVVDNLHKQNMFTLTSFDYMIWQKASLSLFFLGLCLRLQRFRLPALKTVASASFALYFLHEWVLMAMSNSAVITEFRPSIELLSWFYTIAIALGY